MVRGRHGLRRAAHVRAVRRPDGDVHAGSARRPPARRDRADHDGALRAEREHRALRVHSARPTDHLPAELGLVGAPHRLLRDRHRRGGRVHGLEGRREVPRPASGDGRPSRRPVDQLLPDAVRDVHRADQLSERHGVRARSGPPALVTEAERHDARGDERSRPARHRPRRDHRSRRARCRRMVRGRARLLVAARLRAVLRSDRDVHRGPARRPPAGRRRAHPARAVRERPERRAVPVRLARPGSDVPPELRLRREARRVLRSAHRQGGRPSRGPRRPEVPGPLAVTEGPAAGQSINYFRAPFGTYVELISYPKGMAYEATAPIPLWDPRDNRPDVQPVRAARRVTAPSEADGRASRTSRARPRPPSA